MYMESDDKGINYAHIFCDDNYVYTVMTDSWCEIVTKEQVSSFYQDLDGKSISAATAIDDGVLLIDGRQGRSWRGGRGGGCPPRFDQKDSRGGS